MDIYWNSKHFAISPSLLGANLLRGWKASKNTPPATLAGGAKTALLKEQTAVMAALAGLDPAQFSILESLPSKPEDAIALVAGLVEIYLPLSGMVDLDEEHTRLQKELAETQVQIARLEKLLASDFANKAPAAVVQKEREKLAVYQETSEKLKAQL